MKTQRTTNILAEERRLLESESRTANWKRWGPYLSERQWGTVREDYSGDGNPWTYFPHDHARSRAYRWGEDGLLGMTDRQCRLCFALALWNGRDAILKERLFGLTGPEGNHVEDVASKFFEHFIAIADAINHLGGDGLWDDDDGFYYDQIHLDGEEIPLKTRSLVGLVPLFAVEVLEEDVIDSLPGFRKRMMWFLEHRPDLARLISCAETASHDGHNHRHRLLAIPSRERLERMLTPD